MRQRFSPEAPARLDVDNAHEVYEMLSDILTTGLIAGGSTGVGVVIANIIKARRDASTKALAPKLLLLVEQHPDVTVKELAALAGLRGDRAGRTVILALRPHREAGEVQFTMPAGPLTRDNLYSSKIRQLPPAAR
jgi:hypothetical protein